MLPLHQDPKRQTDPEQLDETQVARTTDNLRFMDDDDDEDLDGLGAGGLS